LVSRAVHERVFDAIVGASPHRGVVACDADRDQPRAALRMSREFWLNAPKAVDLHRASERTASLPGPILQAG
jgi:hypothetical protein